MYQKYSHLIYPPLDEVNVRAYPTTKAKVVRLLSVGTPVYLTGASRNGWVELTWDFNTYGWVFNGVEFMAIDWSHMADGYDSPVGTEEERKSAKMFPGAWYDASPFAKRYFIGTPKEAYHTGADLNLPKNADLHDPVYAAADGRVVFSGKLPVWGKVIVIRHDPLPNGYVMWTRYAHMTLSNVVKDEVVRRGQQIATVGTGEGAYSAHLHFDVVRTPVLESSPGDWPSLNIVRLRRNYVDPKMWLESTRPILFGR